jgi:tRNA threonylcarbamoyl adenosine modification protein YeaZ
MLTLAIDTTSEVGGVGIFRDAECLTLVPNDGLAERYSVSLFQMVERALAQAHLVLADIDLYAVANGPGSFTGIRVGLAAARAWGKVFTRPVYGVSVMEAMLYRQGLGAGGWGLGAPAPDWYFPILDARRGEFFLGSFRRITSGPAGAEAPDFEAVDEGRVLKPDALRSTLAGRVSTGESATCLVRAHDQAAVEFSASLPASLNRRQVEGVLVDAIAAVAAREQRSGHPSPSAKLDAYYIRRPDAEIKLLGE